MVTTWVGERYVVAFLHPPRDYPGVEVCADSAKRSSDETIREVPSVHKHMQEDHTRTAKILSSRHNSVYCGQFKTT